MNCIRCGSGVGYNSSTTGLCGTCQQIGSIVFGPPFSSGSLSPNVTLSPPLVTFDPVPAIREALVELQSAAWSRSWKRVRAARARVKELTGIDVPGPLTHEHGKADPARLTRDEDG